MIVKYVGAIFIGFIITISILPILIVFLCKQKMQQNILSYVTMHKDKAGTPTMGGIAFIIAITIATLMFVRGFNSLSIMAIVVMVAFSMIGFLDDFIKFKFKRNLGLRPYQKIIAQLIISIVVAIFAYKSEYVGPIVNVPLTRLSVDFGWFVIPFIVFVFLATTNSVNLTDGLDGLASLTSVNFLLTFAFCLLIQLQVRLDGINSLMLNEYSNILIVCWASVGALIGFLLFNFNPASVFMGDTGSLGLGGLIASIMIFTRNSLFIPIIGLCFVVSSVSVMIQVAYFKLTKRRVFLMAPLHHHFEKKGFKETKIVVCYAILTFMMGLLCLLFELA